MIFMNEKITNLFKILQVAPYERPALSKGFLLPEGICSSIMCQSNRILSDDHSILHHQALYL